MKILAAIVTYNRLELLQRCIKNIKQQKRKVNNLLIINNDSTDGTKNYLMTNNFNHITQKNLGSASGWHSAIQYAIINNFDAIWLMDDDGYPDIDALENLANKLQKNYACISSVVVDENNHDKLVFPMPLLNKKNLPMLFGFNKKIKYLRDFANKNSINYEYNFCHFFNGALISIQHIKQIGNINIKYFMFGDEVDYFFRLRKVGKVVTNLNSIHFHPNVSKRPLSSIKLYYYIKNSIIINYKYFDNSLIRSFLNILIGVIRFVLRNKFKSNIQFFFLSFNFKIIFIAIMRGFRLKIDIDHDK